METLNFHYCSLLFSNVPTLTLFALGKRECAPPSWKSNLHFVSIFRMAWNFQLMFCHADQSMNRNILTPLHLTFSIVGIFDYSLLYTIYNFSDLLWNWNLHWGYSLIKTVRQSSHQLDHVTFCKIVFYSATA